MRKICLGLAASALCAPAEAQTTHPNASSSDFRIIREIAIDKLVTDEHLKIDFLSVAERAGVKVAYAEVSFSAADHATPGTAWLLLTKDTGYWRMMWATTSLGIDSCESLAINVRFARQAAALVNADRTFFTDRFDQEGRRFEDKPRGETCDGITLSGKNE